jgi:hypothetical protein
LRIFERASVFEIGGNARSAKGVAANFRIKPGVARAPADHAVDVDAIHGAFGQLAPADARGAEEGGLLRLEDLGRFLSASNACISAGDAGTIGPKIRISGPDGGSARCNVSRARSA